MNRTTAAGLVVLAVLLTYTAYRLTRPRPLVVGSKAFTESVVLGEMVRHLASSAGVDVSHKREMGGSQVLWKALTDGAVDVYPEYTGTITQEILGGKRVADADLPAELAKFGVGVSRPLGFNNTYVLAVPERTAERLQLRTISDLVKHPQLKLGFSNEFMKRKDGWEGLKSRYALPQTNVVGLDHELAYRAIEAGKLDITDANSTDGNIRYYNLRLLEDDRKYFPEYQAVLCYRKDLPDRHPTVWKELAKLEGALDESVMMTLNGRVALKKEADGAVAADFVSEKFGLTLGSKEETSLGRLLRTTREHLELVLASLAAAVVAAIPLGVLAAKLPRLGQVVLAVVGVIQTIPSLAVLVFMIPFLGIGAAPAMAALFLYSLLPIVRNTCTGIRDIPPNLKESAAVLGLPPFAMLRLVELPLAAPAILAGVKTAAVINVGTATIGALVGAGGYGQPILTGIRLNDTALILQGAVPAAVLALVVQGIFELAERRLVSAGLRGKG